MQFIQEHDIQEQSNPEKMTPKLTVPPMKHEWIHRGHKRKCQDYRERVEEDAEEEDDEEEDDEKDDDPLEASPQDVPERLIGGGEPQEGRLRTSERKQEVERLCMNVSVW